MKFGLVTDPHWVAYSSTVRSRGVKYTTRLENLIQSVNWSEQMALENHCDAIICLGDFFDADFLKSEELTALTEIKWSGLPHLFIVGNHEMGRSSLEFSSMHLFRMIPNATVIDKPQIFFCGDFEMALLPYILETEGKTLSDYFEPQVLSKRFIFSHNDIKGIQMGAFLSISGFEMADIEANCTMFINGHLHNGQRISDKIINLGNLTGQNFSEDASKYSHNMAILDTNTCSLELIENPHAFNFYKLDLRGKEYQACNILKNLKSNAVASITCYPDEAESIRQWATDFCLEHRIVVERKPSTDAIQQPKEELKFDFSTDHLKQFNDFILNELGNDEIVKTELMEVIR